MSVCLRMHVSVCVYVRPPSEVVLNEMNLAIKMAHVRCALELGAIRRNALSSETSVVFASCGHHSCKGWSRCLFYCLIAFVNISVAVWYCS